MFEHKGENENQSIWKSRTNEVKMGAGRKEMSFIQSQLETVVPAKKTETPNNQCSVPGDETQTRTDFH